MRKVIHQNKQFQPRKVRRWERISGELLFVKQVWVWGRLPGRHSLVASSSSTKIPALTVRLSALQPRRALWLHQETQITVHLVLQLKQSCIFVYEVPPPTPRSKNENPPVLEGSIGENDDKTTPKKNVTIMANIIKGQNNKFKNKFGKVVRFLFNK